jgi:tetratricopeptide (TPR) repeat protein
MLGSRLGPYRIDSELGAGGMGRVFAATAEERCVVPKGTRVALKVVHPHLLSEPGFFKRFLREAEISKAVVHGNVVRCYDADALSVEGRQHNFLVMEYVEGQTLRSLLEELERVPEELCRHIGREVSKGLSAVHEAGFVHRDLKPENVLITPDHEVKIMDLGVARLKDEVIRLSRSGAFVGSPLYASPEQFRGAGEDLDGRSDLFALGVILYELACGCHPHPGDDFVAVLGKVVKEEPRRLGEQNPQVSAFYEEVVHALLEKEPERRFDSARKLLTVLERGEDSTWWGRRAKAIRVSTRRPLRRIRIPRETAVYGRAAELGRLRELYAQAAAGNGRVALIEGEAGIGKTRLVDELVGRLQHEGEDLNFLFGTYPPGGAATAAGAWSTAYREHFGSEGLVETLEEYLPVTPVLVPAFAALLRGEPTPPGEEALTKDSVQTVFVHATRQLSRARTTVVLIEDLHFAPEEGRAMFASLALAAPEHRILLVGTARRGLPEAWWADLERLEHASRMELNRLGPKDLAELLRDAFRSDRLAEELGFRIGEKSDGNPFFVFEIIRGLREEKLLRKRPDGTWATTGAIREIRIPSSVQDLIQARIAELDEAEQELLDVAACCGFEFDPSLLADAIGAPRIPVFRKLGHLEKAHRLVRSAGRRFVFDHHQVQETLYQGLSKVLAGEYHAAIARALEARSGADGLEPAEVGGALAVDLAEHCLAGGEGERALRYLDPALDHLEAGYMNDRAIRLTDRVLAVPGLLAGGRRAEVLIRKSQRLDLLGRREEQAAAIEEALELACTGGDGALELKARQARGTYLVSIAKHGEGRRELETALEMAREAGDRKEEGVTRGNLGLAYWFEGRTEEALASFESHLEISRETGDRHGEARATGNMGLVIADLGRYEEALELDRRCAALAREIGERRTEGTATLNQGLVLWYMGRYEEAKEHDLRCIAMAREIGDRRNEELATGNLGLVYWSLGENEEAMTCFERHLELAREIGDRRGEGLASENLGLVLSRLGRRAEARVQYERHLAIARETGDRRGEGRAVANLGGLYRALGGLERALGLYEQHHAIAGEVGDRRGVAVSLRNLGSIKIEMGDPDGAVTHLEEALALCREIGARDFEAHTLGALGHAARLRGDRAEARRFAEEALALYRELGHQVGVAASLVDLGGLAEEAGDTDAARAACAEARDIAERTKNPGGVVQAAALLAALGGDVEEAIRAYEESEALLSVAGRIEARFLHWKAAKDPACLEEAHRLLTELRDHAPERYRETILAGVPLHRRIVAAWESRDPPS